MNIKPLSEFNRNQNAVIDELRESQEPVYLTKNGAASVVVMDAAAFDRAMSFRADLRAREMRTYEGLLRGYSDVENGDVMSLDAMDARVREAKGWSR